MAKTKAKSRVSAKAAPTPTTAVEHQTEAPNRKLGRSTAGKRGAGLPPGSGEPPPQRAVKVLSFPERGVDSGGRSRMAAGLQQAVGNARMGRMLEQGQPAGPLPAGQESGKGPAGTPPSGSGGAVPGGAGDAATAGGKSAGARGGAAAGAATGAPADAKPPSKKLGLVGRMVARVKAALAGKKGEGKGADKDAKGKKGEKDKAKKARDEKKAKKGEGKGEKKAKVEKKGEKEKAAGGGEAPPGAAAGAGAGAAGPGPAPAPAAPKAAAAAGGGSAGVVEGFTRSTASQVAAGIASFGQRTAVGINEDRQATEKKAAPLATGSDGGADARVLPPPPSQPEAKPFAGEEPAPPAASVPKSGVRASGGGGGGKYGNEVKKLNKVSTDAGPRQRFKPVGEANPQQAAQAEQQSLGETQAKHGALAQQISANPGEQRVQPQAFSEQRLLIVPANAEGPPETAQTPEMAEYLQLPFESGVRGQVDKALTPKMEKSLAGPRERIAEGARKRDADVESRLAESQQEAVTLGQDADREQAQTVQEARAGVVAEKEKGLAEGRQKLDAVNTEISQKRRDKVGEINRRIESDEKKADDELEKAEKKSEDEKTKSKKKADDEKKKAKKKEDDLPWYKKIAKFFTSIFDALVKVVTKILDAVKSVVKGIISAAQKLAKGLIDACTKFVTAAIKAFGDLAKSLVTNLVGAVFPELAAKINQAIDAAVEVATEVVKQIGDKLKEGVDKIADTLNAAVDFVHNFYSTLVTGALRVLQAALTGDFLGIFIEAFRAAANSVGLPGDALIETLKRAGKQLIHVIKNPATFIGNMVKAFMKGIDQFMGNFAQHMKTALMGWLFGQVAATGIKLPEKFDLAGIFDLVRQVLGLTYEYVRERAVSILGEEKVAMIEKVAGYVKRLFTEGPAALWKEFKQYLGDLKDQIVSQAKDWLITKIVQAAIVKLTTMLIPGGGFVQAILSIWETLKFLKERINEILKVVNSVLDSIEQIANGAIGAAANYIEQTIVKTMPLVMDFLARLLKIGNIGGQIRKIIDKLRQPVNKAVDFVVGGAVKLVGAGWGAVKKGAAAVKGRLVAWWKKKAAFKLGKEEHHVEFQGKGSAAKLVVNSRTEGIVAFIQGKPFEAKVKSILKEFFALKDEEERLADSKATKYKGDKAGTASEKRQVALTGIGEKISGKFEEIAAAMREGGAQVYKSKFVTPPTAGPWGSTGVHAYIATDPGRLKQSKPTDPKIIQMAQGLKAVGAAAYDPGHLLAQQLHGSGKKNNLMVIPSTLNGTMSAQVEEPASKQVFGSNAVVEYTVTPTYGRKSESGHEGEWYVPLSVKMTAQEVKVTEAAGDDIQRVTPKTNLPGLNVSIPDIGPFNEPQSKVGSEPGDYGEKKPPAPEKKESGLRQLTLFDMAPKKREREVRGEESKLKQHKKEEKEEDEGQE